MSGGYASSYDINLQKSHLTVGVTTSYVERDESNFNAVAGNIMHSNVTCCIT